MSFLLPYVQVEEQAFLSLGKVVVRNGLVVTMPGFKGCIHKVEYLSNLHKKVGLVAT